MKSPYVTELQPNQMVTAVFLVQSKDIRQKKTGEPYLSLVLSDRTGELDAKMWDNAAEVLDTFERDDYVRVKGLMQIYHNRPQFTVHKMQRVEPGEVDGSDYYPASQRDSEEMFRELQGIIASIGNPHLRRLLEIIFADPFTAKAFRTAPAAKGIHHAFLGGLLEHVLSVCQLCRATAPQYRLVDLDLLLTGAVLHDIGKITELSYDRSFSYTAEGQLLGHILIGLRLVQDTIRLVPGFPPKLQTLLEHLIVSHHGELAYGSPKVPLFPEALLLHHLDNLDSKMENMRATIERDRHVDGVWTSYSPALERSILKKNKFLDDAPVSNPIAAASVIAAPIPVAAVEPGLSRSAPPPQERRPLMGGIFGDKLQAALKK